MADRNAQAPLRRELRAYLSSEHAHAPLSAAVRGLTPEQFNRQLPGLPYTAWALVEHIRRAQRDMLDFIRKRAYKPLQWPRDYWPPEGERADRKTWRRTLRACESDRRALIRIVADAGSDLTAPLPNGDGQTLLREVLQVIDHASYHTGALFVLRRLLRARK